MSHPKGGSRQTTSNTALKTIFHTVCHQNDGTQCTKSLTKEPPSQKPRVSRDGQGYDNGCCEYEFRLHPPPCHCKTHLCMETEKHILLSHLMTDSFIVVTNSLCIRSNITLLLSFSKKYSYEKSNEEKLKKWKSYEVQKPL